MPVAIVGAGLAGLSIAYKLAEYGPIDLFYDRPGASHAASGLMHPFVGETGEKSFRGDEAFNASFELMTQVGGSFYTKSPFVKYPLDSSVRAKLLKYAPEDLSPLDQDHLLIHNAARVDVPAYLKKLLERLKGSSVNLYEKKIGSLTELDSYDQVIIAAGYGIKELAPELKLKYLKGQSLVFENQHKHQLPLIAKGYLVPFEDKVIIGSTYEKKFQTVEPDIYSAYLYLEEPLKTFFQPYHLLTPQQALSGVRVAHPNFSYPKIIMPHKKTLIVTGLGSRGLLYHGLLAKLIENYIVKGVLDRDFFIKRGYSGADRLV